MGLFGRGIIGSNNGNEIKASGGVITINGDYKTHTFNQGIGSFNVHYLPSSLTEFSASILAVAGGGAGGDIGQESGGLNGQGGGGGAGGLVYIPDLSASLSLSSYSITVGDGGVGVTGGGSTNGEDTLITGTGLSLIAKGGGRGGSAAFNPGQNGGNGGGGAGLPSSPTYPDYKISGSEIQSSQAGDSSTYGYGNDGGNGLANTQSPGSGGGANGAGNTSSIGGVGLQIAEFGNIYYAGGGSAGGNNDEPAQGGGGRGRSNKDGTDGLGGGGGGGDRSGTGSAGGDGGSGIVKIRYKYKNL